MVNKDASSLGINQSVNSLDSLRLLSLLKGEREGGGARG